MEPFQKNIPHNMRNTLGLNQIRIENQMAGILDFPSFINPGMKGVDEFQLAVGDAW